MSQLRLEMVAWRRLGKLSAAVVGAGIISWNANKVYASWTNSERSVDYAAIWDPNWDFREPKSLVRPIKNDSVSEQNRYNTELEGVRVKSTRNIILIRHGEYLDVGEFDQNHHLTDRGRIQAKYTGRRLNELGMKWDKVIVSTMVRARETADIILKEIEFDPKSVKYCDMLREGAPIPPQPPIGHWRPEKSQFFRDGARIEAAFRKYFHRAFPDEKDDSYTLIVGHANVIRYFVCRALQLPPEAWLRININHGSITWLKINPSGNVSIKHLGETGYMPPEHLTDRIPRPAKNII